MVEKDTERFDTTIRGDELDAPHFWYCMRDHPCYKRNEHLIDRSRSLAIKIHGDGAPTDKADG
eukprot:586336-Pyramimonas_sp.AAC.1